MVLRKRKRDQPTATVTELPLVERVNALPIHEFVQRYTPQEALKSEIPIGCTTPKRTEEGRIGQNDRDGQKLYFLKICSSKSITQTDFDACFHLIELTSSDAYKQSTVGWSRVKKRKEMKLLDMRYILVRRKHATESNPENVESSDVEGFLSFMVTYEDEVEVIYCYEIHLAPSLRNNGLGKRLIGLYEEIGRKVGLKKAMLTVFRSNRITLRFYQKLGYEEDEFSPRPKRLRNGIVKEPDYMILSKSLQDAMAPKNETNPESSGET